MNSYLVRIELHQATFQDYTNLHAYMHSLGFKRTIAGSTGSYQLPTAEYALISSKDTSAVRDLAKSAAIKTGKSYWVIAVAYADAAWELPIVK